MPPPLELEQREHRAAASPRCPPRPKSPPQGEEGPSSTNPGSHAEYLNNLGSENSFELSRTQHASTVRRMAQRQTTHIIDDLDGTVLESAETLQFGLEGKSYEIDLSAEHAANLRDAIAPFIAAARKTSSQTASKAKVSNRHDLNEVRAWARANGYTVSDRGRVKAEILEAFDNSN